MFYMYHRFYCLVLSRTVSIRSLTTILDICWNNGWSVPLCPAGRAEWPRSGDQVMRIVRNAYIHGLPTELSAPGSTLKIYFRDTPRLSRKVLMSAGWCESVKSPDELMRKLPLLTIWGAIHSNQYGFIECGPSMENDLVPLVPGILLRDDVPDRACQSEMENACIWH